MTQKELNKIIDKVFLEVKPTSMKDMGNIMKVLSPLVKGKASKDKATWEEHKKTMQEAGIEEWFIDSCEKIKYMFPKAHAAAYVISAFRIAWYKVHMPVYFYASWLTSKATDVDVDVMIKGYDAIKAKIIEIQNKGFDATNKELGQLESLKVCLEATARGISFAPIDLYKSSATVWGVKDETTIYPPFASIDGLGDTVAKKIVEEMEHRYDLLSDSGTKNIEGYNKLMQKKIDSGDISAKKLPYIVVLIDELADLMLVAAKEVEDSIMRITQMARAAGIHLIVATQRPSTDVITGVVKANIPSRISFAVSSSIDSRTILDSTGAEKLFGKGDMLFLPMGDNHPTRIQGAFISEEEIQKVVDFVCEQQKAQYDNSLTEMKNDSSSHNDGYSSEDEYEDPLYNEIVDYVIQAARMIDLLEERGIVGPPNGSKPREVLVKYENNDKEEQTDD